MKNVDEASMASFVFQGLAKISKACTRKDKELKQECANVQTALQKAQESGDTSSTADIYFLPFKLACEASNNKTRTFSLDTLQKLIAYGYLIGDSTADPKMYPPASRPNSKPTESKEDESKKTRRLADVIVDTIAQCALFDDDQVQHMVIKALLTAVTSVSFQVHGAALLQSVQSCFQIFLMSRNPNNRTSAKGTLTQMLNIVFQRMEHFSAQVQQIQKIIAEEKATAGAAATSPAPPTTDASEVNGTGEAENKTEGENGMSKEEEERGTGEIQKEEGTEVKEATQETQGSQDNVVQAGQQQQQQAIQPEQASQQNRATSPNPVPLSDPSAQEGKFGVCVVCGQPANNYCLQTKASVCSAECKVTNNDRTLYLGAMKSAADEDHQVHLDKVLAKFARLQKDAVQVFRALCTLSMRNLPDPPDNLALRSKTQALELLLSVLEHSGNTFRHSPRFIALVKDDLVMSLLKNSVTPIEAIFRLSSQIFIALIRHFKPYLKTEIGAFMEQIFLKVLASPNSTYEHKVMALTVFNKLLSDAPFVVETFLNYDCDINNFNVFQPVVQHLAKIAQQNESYFLPEQEQSVRKLALEALICTLKSLVSFAQSDGQGQGAVGQSLLGVADPSGLAETEKGKPPSSSSSASGSAGDKEEEDDEADSTGGKGQPAHKQEEKEEKKSTFSQNFNIQKERQEKLELGVLKFNVKPKKGLAYLHEHGIVEKTPAAVAHFFQTTPNVDKVMMGDWIGEPADFNKAVLHAYVDNLDFRQLTFDEALRHFLSSGFRLPGEPEKIDRMMEKFAEQYGKHNPGVFANSDQAYVLAYAVIMLNTDAHNPQVTNKMTKDQFIRNCSVDGDLDTTLLTNIYHRIVNHEIKMKDDPLASSSSSSAQHNVKKRNINFMKETFAMVKKTQELIKSKQSEEGGGEEGGNGSKGSSDSTSLSPDFVLASEAGVSACESMFEILWYPCLATLSVLLETSEDPVVVTLCLDGYLYSIRLASMCGMDTSRLAFVGSLKKFTLLGSNKEMKVKNVEAIRMLLKIAYEEGNNLKESWGEVLSCISEFEKLHITSAQAVDVFQISPISSNATHPLSAHAAPGLGGQGVDAEVQRLNAAATAERIEWSSVDRVFTQSNRLNGEAIVDFVDQLRRVSMQELSSTHAPRVFCLQKIVEITYYNMGRIRLVWTRIWKVLSDFFVEAGCHSNLNISMYVVDLLRQLAMKFLEKDELANFHFQKQFLKPFEAIMAGNRSTENRELIVQCLERMIMARYNNVKSGWKTVFVVLTSGAKDTHEPLVEGSFSMMRRIMTQYFQLVVETTDTIDECINCLVAFGANKFTDISLEAVEFLLQCSTHLGTAGSSLTPTTTTTTSATATIANAATTTTTTTTTTSTTTSVAASAPSSISSAAQGDAGSSSSSSSSSSPSSSPSPPPEGKLPTSSLKVWFLLLTGLSSMVGDQRLEVRSRALTALFSVLHQHGALFTLSTWQLVFRGVLFPIFDDVRDAEETEEKQAAAGTSVKDRAASFGTSWLQTTCLAALSTLVELFCRFHAVVASLLPELLDLIHSCIERSSEELASIGVKCWVLLLQEGGSKFGDKDCSCILSSLSSIFVRTLPGQLQDAKLRAVLNLPNKPPGGHAPLPFYQPVVLPSPTSASSSSPVSSQQSPPQPTPAPAPNSTATATATTTPDGKPPLSASQPPPPPAAAAGGGGAGGAGVGGGQNAESKDISLDTPPNRSGVVLPFHVRAVVTKCKVQLMLMDASFEFLTKFFPSATATAAQGPSNSSSSSPLSTKHVFMVLHALTQSIEFARVFNHDIELRQRLYQVGFMRNRQASPPELFFQEAHGLKLYLQILLRVYLFEEGKVASGQGDSASSTAVADRLITMSQFVLSEYVQKQKNKEHPDMLRCMDTVICTLLEGLLSLSEAQFQQHISIFYYPLAELIQYGS
eukprot:CAMPEP_0175130550 /NCGR_PEP_ID=MMETSP0087-20121206/6066_1 /TAXON_ID=136419 /ORGANISM="Unknown Unknown, Strain D1" /LENGTH=1929 /DNA_ID=CAMNT_0016412775 /DNA_START=93 /DNA_END=5878 /DNA_ORIENTATION=-